MTTHGVHAVVGLDGFNGISGSFNITRERLTRLELPEQFTEDHVERMARDLEILHKMVEDHPIIFRRMCNSVLEFDFNKANALAGEIGLDEHRITRQGGGLNWIIVGIAIGCALLLSSDNGPKINGGGDSGGGTVGGGDTGGTTPGGTPPVGSGDAGGGRTEQ